jgi:chromosome segregation ATPase
LLSPHSNRNWSSADEITLLNITKLLAHLKGFNGQINELEEELARARQASQDFQNQAEQAHAQNEAIRSQLQTLQAQSEQSQVEVSSLAALISARKLSRSYAPKMKN